jgi:hypothetical protein
MAFAPVMILKGQHIKWKLESSALRRDCLPAFP